MPIADVTEQPLEQLVSLSGRVAVVTGAARGIGAAIARRYAEAGAAVLLGDLDVAAARQAADELAATGAPASGHAVDVLDERAVAALADAAVDAHGRLDVWVNNAGIYPTDPALEMPLAQWQSVLDVNLTGTYVGAREAARRMIAAGAGGVIVNIASSQGFRAGGPGLAHYVASKHGVVGLTKSLAVELGPHDIRVLALAPTLIATPGTLAGKEKFAEVLGTDEDPWEVAARDYLALGRPGVPDDVARVALFCASDLSGFMTGATLPVDAGYLAL
jgi:NAD(P)-dependent dehydrogenase (short-subunit alcohol dehydrogenase family)